MGAADLLDIEGNTTLALQNGALETTPLLSSSDSSESSESLDSISSSEPERTKDTDERPKEGVAAVLSLLLIGMTITSQCKGVDID
jgi:hypothetical protein